MESESTKRGGRGRWRVVRGGRARTYTFEHALWSGAELRALLERAGFVDVKLHGGFRGEACGPGTQRLLAAGRRPSL